MHASLLLTASAVTCNDVHQVRATLAHSSAAACGAGSAACHCAHRVPGIIRAAAQPVGRSGAHKAAQWLTWRSAGLGPGSMGCRAAKWPHHCGHHGRDINQHAGPKRGGPATGRKGGVPRVWATRARPERQFGLSGHSGCTAAHMGPSRQAAAGIIRCKILFNKSVCTQQGCVDSVARQLAHCCASCTRSHCQPLTKRTPGCADPAFTCI